MKGILKKIKLMWYLLWADSYVVCTYSKEWDRQHYSGKYAEISDVLLKAVKMFNDETDELLAVQMTLDIINSKPTTP